MTRIRFRSIARPTIDDRKEKNCWRSWVAIRARVRVNTGFERDDVQLALVGLRRKKRFAHASRNEPLGELVRKRGFLDALPWCATGRNHVPNVFQVTEFVLYFSMFIVCVRSVWKYTWRNIPVNFTLEGLCISTHERLKYSFTFAIA
jgi:hypothetical protein